MEHKSFNSLNAKSETQTRKIMSAKLLKNRKEGC